MGRAGATRPWLRLVVAGLPKEDRLVVGGEEDRGTGRSRAVDRSATNSVSTVSVALAVVPVVFLVTSLMGFCPAYVPSGISNCTQPSFPLMCDGGDA